MNLCQEVTKRMKPYMRTKGFSLSGRTFYCIQNDIAFCIGFENPTGTLYVWQYIMPLYIPSEYLYLSYGDRMHRFDLPFLTRDDTPEMIDQWCAQLCQLLEETIFPYFEQIDSQQKLLQFIAPEKADEYRIFLFCPEIWMEKLRMYTYAYLQNEHEYAEARIRFEQQIQNAHFLTEAGKARNRTELQALPVPSNGDWEQVESFMIESIGTTKKLFVKSNSSTKR